MNVSVVLRVSKQIKIYDLRKLVNYKKILDFMASTQRTIQKPNLEVFGKIWQKIKCKTFRRKIYFGEFRQFVYNIMFKIV